ncbi:inositol monophosphatase [Ancylobacter sp. 6x-1]|uniref:Inositol monophosphatase n=1 Tax=Ancylobacter crimeensis TaxID=2579147 RepID=A0ABT0DBX6_9HYPH|nr:inositol monophosphatase [Ancylobacter crimeensis]MCK0197252.1 inositol monophosphatase [Ancylobacter crimeensis]
MSAGLTADDPLKQRRAFAEDLARAAGRKARTFFVHRETLVTDVKTSSQDLVSQADRTVEALLRRAIRRQFPEDAIVGEEDVPVAGRSGYVWVLDPIDGTMPFLVGQPNWCVSIAIGRNEQPVAGVVYAPVLRELYSAVEGGGATLNGAALRVNPDWTLASTNVGFGATQKATVEETAAFVAGLYREGGVLFRVGSGALMLSYVAANRLAGYYDPHISSWDCWAAMAIIREAGGRAEFSGDLHRPGRLWAGNERVIADLKRLSGEPG